ncbi:MAG: N-acetyltransferase family protein [Planctomycetales bacterium]|jgi:ribosomal protein S18 acetylase RimI-like enzyme
MSDIEITIRDAKQGDAQTIAEFNCRLAAETEDKQLDPETVRKGVDALLNDARRGRYLVACAREGRIVGQLMHTFEWSDWRNGDIWWLQSVYVHADFRRQGVFRKLNQHLEQLAESTSGVVGLRLYVENENARAQETYRSLRFVDPGYRVMERMFD